MRRLLRRLRRRLRRPSPTPPVTPPARDPDVDGLHRATNRPPLTDRRVRDQWFTPVRRGIDRDEVAAFLHLVADELVLPRAELARSDAENARIKTALRQCQSRFAPRFGR